MVCDRTSVGIIARDEDERILILRRKKYPYGYCPPAGHCDGLSYPAACFKEFEEETGLKIVGAPKPLPLREPKIGGPFGGCRRGGEYHFWQVFEVRWRGTFSLNAEEAEWIGWKDAGEIMKLARRTVCYLESLKIAGLAEDMARVEMLKSGIESGWKNCPGLGVTWFNIFRDLRII